MDFALTEEQQALAEAVRSFLAGRLGAAGVRAVVDDPHGDGEPAGLWAAAGEQGWLAVLVPESAGGLELGMLAAQVVARELGAATVPLPWASAVLAGEAVRLAGSRTQQRHWLPRLAAGEVHLSLATHRGGDPAVAALPAPDAAGRLTGVLPAVEYAHLADALVTATADGRLWLVDPAGPGVSMQRYDALDRTTRLAEVTLRQASAEPLDGVGADPAPMAELHARAAVLTAADLVGVARSALDRTVAYDRDREQFGRPVGSFQAVKHALADLHVAVTMAEHGVLYAAAALDAGRPDAAHRQQAVSVAKAKASDAARDATAAMIQYHGGIGYTWEHDAHLYFKRAAREQYLYGDSAWHFERLADLLLADARHGQPASAAGA